MADNGEASEVGDLALQTLFPSEWNSYKVLTVDSVARGYPFLGTLWDWFGTGNWKMTEEPYRSSVGGMLCPGGVPGLTFLHGVGVPSVGLSVVGGICYQLHSLQLKR